MGLLNMVVDGLVTLYDIIVGILKIFFFQRSSMVLNLHIKQLLDLFKFSNLEYNK